MPDFQVRVNGAFADVTAAVESVQFAMGVADLVAYQHEDGNRTHCHLYLFGAVYKIDKLRRECRRFFTGNAEFSCKAKAGKNEPITLEGAVRYGSRNGKLTAVHVTGFDKGRIVSLENEYRKTKVALPLNHYQKLFKAFEDEYPDMYNELQRLVTQPYATQYSQYHFIKIRAKRFAFDYNLAIMSPKTFTEWKVIVNTYCMRYGIMLDPQDKISM